jgi:membrane protease YdiL (CAAX protease family)
MDLNIKKPLHIISLLILLFAFYVLIVSPILSFIGVYPSTQTEGIYLSDFIILFSSIISIMIFIGVPIIWYLWVNNINLKNIFDKLKIRKDKFDEAFLWGFISTIIMFIIIFLTIFSLNYLDINKEDLSNVPDLARNISIGSMFFVIIFQSIGEEIFFRGFLMNKFDDLYGKNIAIFSTAILFGIAHMTYGKLYPVIMTIIMGVILGFVVFKTKNLYSAIISHLLFNIFSYTSYIFAESYLFEALTI